MQVYIPDDDGVNIADLNSSTEILLTEHSQEALHYADVSTTSDDLSQKNIVTFKFYIDSRTYLS